MLGKTVMEPYGMDLIEVSRSRELEIQEPSGSVGC